jgi:hypothetical protein
MLTSFWTACSLGVDHPSIAPLTASGSSAFQTPNQSKSKYLTTVTKQFINSNENTATTYENRSGHEYARRYDRRYDRIGIATSVASTGRNGE